MDLSTALPPVGRLALFKDRQIAVIGVSTIVHDDAAHYFEISKPKYWRCPGEPGQAPTIVGIGGIGGTLRRDEKILDGLKREVEEEIGVPVQLELPAQSFLIQDWQVAGPLDVPPSKKHPKPLMVILTPPRLGGPNMPDHLAIICFQTQLKGEPVPDDLFGLLRLEDEQVAPFFTRDEWPLEEARALPGVDLLLNGQPPDRAVLRPVLTARAFQLLVRGEHV